MCRVLYLYRLPIVDGYTVETRRWKKGMDAGVVVLDKYTEGSQSK